MTKTPSHPATAPLDSAFSKTEIELLGHLDPQAASDALHRLLPEEKGYWLRYLHNNRRVDRAPAYRIRFRKRGRSVVYDFDDLAAFVKWEKQRRFGIAKVPGRATDAITVKLDPYCMEALRDLERRTEIPASEILEHMFPALLMDLYDAMGATLKAPQGRERAALDSWFERRKAARMTTTSLQQPGKGAA